MYTYTKRDPITLNIQDPFINITIIKGLNIDVVDKLQVKTAGSDR